METLTMDFCMVNQVYQDGTLLSFYFHVIHNLIFLNLY